MCVCKFRYADMYKNTTVPNDQQFNYRLTKKELKIANIKLLLVLC